LKKKFFFIKTKIFVELKPKKKDAKKKVSQNKNHSTFAGTAKNQNFVL
jgi:hypothetical protein